MTIKEARTINVKISGVLDKRIPIRVAYALQKNYKNIQEIMEIAAKRQEQIINEYAKKDENGEFIHPKDEEGNELKDQISIDENRLSEFAKVMGELENEDIDIDVTTIKLADLDKCDEDGYDPLTSNDMAALMFMIGEDENG